MCNSLPVAPQVQIFVRVAAEAQGKAVSLTIARVADLPLVLRRHRRRVAGTGLPGRLAGMKKTTTDVSWKHRGGKTNIDSQSVLTANPFEAYVDHPNSPVWFSASPPPAALPRA